MKKYAIVKRESVTGYIDYEAHKYNLLFRVFGACADTNTHISGGTPEDCKHRLKLFVNNGGKASKYTVIEIVEI